MPVFSAPNGLPLDRAPAGMRAGRALIDALIGKSDNTVERYLERKRELDLASKAGQAKLAKFILGASNRDPSEAERYFEGFGVMVIGMDPAGEIVGASLPDPEQWEDGIVRFIGQDGPHWDIQTVVHSDSEDPILVVLVDPPKHGDPVHICRKDGDGVVDGQVYIRRRGKTQQADSAEMHMLLARAKEADPTVELDISLDGEAVPVSVDREASFEEHLTRKKDELLAALPQPNPKPKPERGDTSGALGKGLAGLDLTAFQDIGIAQIAKSMRPTFEITTEPHRELSRSALGITDKPEPRSEQEYREEIDDWVREFRIKIPRAIDRMAAYIMKPMAIRVHNQADAYLEDVAITIHLEGPVRAIDWYELDRNLPRNHFDLPKPPRKWGPVKENWLPHALSSGTSWGAGPLATNSPTVSWENSGSVMLEVMVNPLPPRKLHTDSSGEFVLLLPAEHTEDVRGTWTATARGHNKRYEGELVVPLGPDLDVTGRFRKWLGIGK